MNNIGQTTVKLDNRGLESFGQVAATVNFGSPNNMGQTTVKLDNHGLTHVVGTR